MLGCVCVQNHTDCKCVGGLGFAVPGTCGSGCSHLLVPFMVLLGITSFVASFSQTPSFMMILRCTPPPPINNPVCCHVGGQDSNRVKRESKNSESAFLETVFTSQSPVSDESCLVSPLQDGPCKGQILRRGGSVHDVQGAR